jgi:hypothetical protein
MTRPATTILFLVACTSPKPGAEESHAADSGESGVGETHTAETETAGHTSESAAESEDSSAHTAETDTAPAPSTRWSALSMDYTTAAALTDNGTLVCWGDPGTGNTTCPTGPFVEVAQSLIHGCALDAAGQATCWGADGTADEEYRTYAMNQARPPKDVLHGLTAGPTLSCGLDGTDALVCWGDINMTPPPKGSFRMASIGYTWACGLREEGTLECWGAGFPTGTRLPPLDSDIVDFSCGFYHGCAIHADASVTCWGGDYYQGTAEVPEGLLLTSVSAGPFEETCGITPDQEIRCWETPTLYRDEALVVERAPTTGRWTSVAVGFSNACALSAEGEIHCWGSDKYQITPVPELP